MIENLKYWYSSILEQQNFPGWEIFIFLNTCFWLSVIVHLHRIHRDNKEMKQWLTAYASQIIADIRNKGR